MIFETIFENKYGADIHYPSPVQDCSFSFGEGEKRLFRSTDPCGVFSRYEKIIFLKAHEIYTQSSEDRNLTIRKLLWVGLKCIVRKNWEEPKRKFPSLWMLNKSDVALQTVYPDAFNLGRKALLFWDLPTLVEVPPYSNFAEWKKYTLGVPDRQAQQHPMAIPGASYNFLESNKLEQKRSPQELERLAKMMAEWRKDQRDRIRLM